MVVEVDVPGEDVELAVDALFGLGATAVSEQADGAVVTLTADLPDGAHLDGLRWPARTVVPAAPAAPPPPPPTRVGRVVVHHPDHPVAPPDGGVAVAIDPEGAFGHGAHPTTVLALEALVARAEPGRSVLDVGSGTGVLSVVAAATGCLVHAVDVDEAAVRATRRNAGLNGVTVIATRAIPADVEGTFDVVVANLLLREQRAVAGDLVRLVAPGGWLVVSGLLTSQLDELLAELPAWPAERLRHPDGWAAAALRRPPARRERGSPPLA